ncbi:von Willebrand factor type A domain-containing protein [Favolaschia claudopus]|uniref:von Willebrand factor type A domain-containing protein n=1 Tax=Favolaschia claudopus TaxID=2862362 RepID=A0AAW0DQ08_9AGAR
MSQVWGLCYSLGSRSTSLPLVQVKVEATLKVLAAQVKISQTYVNDTDEAIETAYMFPVPARAAVNSFAMVKQDGTRVIGRIEGREEAREIYNAAVSQGKRAALLEQQTPDVFKIGAGKIQAQERVHIELIYATELAEDEENDSIRFHIPLHIGARYGRTAGTQPKMMQQVSSAFLDISASIQMASPITKISSPSHPIATELGPNPILPNANANDLPFSNYARISLSSDSPLDKDFVLTVKSAGLDSPRCVAELHPAHCTTALVFTMVPRFKLPDLPRQEFVFLIDRSGSMNGARITAAKKALVVMLRSLPAEGSSLQVASFGDQCTLPWNDGSRPYDQATLDEATQHVDSMQADYGGTEIRQALHRCFESRKVDRPTSVFVLTDGEAWDVKGVIDEVKLAVTGEAAQSYLRVFVLGIGRSASTAMCEGIARVGNGTCMMVGEQETGFTGKIARLLKAARTPLITDINIDWGVSPVAAPPATAEEDDFVMIEDENESKGEGKVVSTLNVFDEAVDPLQMDVQPPPAAPEVVLPPSAQVQQSPFKIRTLSPGNRLNAYAILQGQNVPQNITLSGTTMDGSSIQLVVPVTLSNLPNALDTSPAVHALSARKIIQDIEDGQHAITTSPDIADLLARTTKALVARLGKTYSISSSQTSFVAVDESGTHCGVHIAGASESRETEPDVDTIILDQLLDNLRAGSGKTTGRKRRRQLRRCAETTIDNNSTMLDAKAAGPFRLASLHRILASNTLPSEDTDDMLAGRPLPPERSTARRNEVAKMVGDAAPTSGPPPPPLPPPPLAPPLVSPRNKLARMVGPPTSGLPLPPSPPVDPLETLARLQSFDGRFRLGVLSVVKINVPVDEARSTLNVTQEVFVTIIAMAFLCTKLGSDVDCESWAAMHEKARAFVQKALQGAGGMSDVDELQVQAITYLA